MSERDYNMERIDRYLTGVLEGEELQAFEAEMELDADLRNEVALQRDLKVGAEAFFDEELKAKLKRVDEELAASGSKGKEFFFKPWRPVGIAASVILLVGLAYLLLVPSPNSTTLFDSYYQPYPNIVNPIERSAANLQNDGLSNYERGEYQQAISRFNEEIKEFPQSDFRKFYQALSYLETGDNQNAEIRLQEVLIEPSSEFYHPAQWYLALTYLKAKNIEDAKNQLQVIAGNPGDYQIRARELLDQL